MNKRYYFDPVSKGFYIFPDSPVIPKNAVEINERSYLDFAGIPWPEGKTLGTDINSFPEWIDTPPLSQEELLALTEIEKTHRINEANDYINSNQWPSKLALGRLSDNERILFNEWLDYLDLLSSLEVNKIKTIEWPTLP